MLFSINGLFSQRLQIIIRQQLENRAALIIQSRARGIAGRMRCIRMRQERAKERAQMAAAALLVQKCYRGHRDRLRTQVIILSIDIAILSLQMIHVALVSC
jgi:hypothetical protein